MALRRLLRFGRKSPKSKMITEADTTVSKDINEATEGVAKMTVSPNTEYKAQFGCAPGVIRTRVGFTGGKKSGPTYYSLGDHTETVDIQYDPTVTSYREMLKMFWNNHDSTACHSRQYMSAIFYHDEEQKKLAEQTKEEHQKTLSKPIVTRITEAGTFYEAENYHQKYLLRQNREILRALKLSDKELIASKIATRLNGYCGGYGKLSDLEKEIDSFGLDEPTQQDLRRIVGRGTHH